MPLIVPVDEHPLCRHFVIESQSFLALANGGKFSSEIYKWDGQFFQPFQTMSGHTGAADWEFFEIGSEPYLALAVQSSTSVVFKWATNKFVEHQPLPTRGANDFEFFSFGGNHFLAVANGTPLNVDSVIYLWNGTQFVTHQPITTHSAYDLEYFSIGGKHFLAVANARDGASNDINSKVYTWNGDKFADYQDVLTHGGIALDYFKLGEDHMLAIANNNDGLSGGPYWGTTTDSVIYKFS